jgi:arylsulfatase
MHLFGGRARRRLLVGASAGLVASLALAAIGLGRAHLRGRPNVLFIVVDSLRADRVGCCGSRQGLTPFLDQLASASLVYDHAYSPSSWTLPSVVSLFTGQFPSEHGAIEFWMTLPTDKESLAEALAARGYATSGVTANSVIKSFFGFDRGFERYALVGEPTLEFPKSDGSLINDQVLGWADEVGSARPHFVYLHYMDVHMPYRSHAGVTAERAADLPRSDELINHALSWNMWEFAPSEIWRLEDLYDGEVRHVDAVLQSLFTGLEQRGFLNNALVIVTADHGEQFGRHNGAFGHGTSLHQEAIHVPLIIRTPDGVVGRISEPVQVGGLAALILAAAGAARPSTVHIDAPPTSPGQPPVAGGLVARSELLRSSQAKRWSHLHALMAGSSKLLVTPDDRELVYDLDVDPFERRPHDPSDGSLRAMLDRQLAGAQANSDVRQVTPDDATRERLRAAGYLHDQ